MILRREYELGCLLSDAGFSINTRLELGADVETSLVLGTYLVITRCFPLFAMSRKELNAVLAAEYCSTVASENAAEGCFFSQSFKLVSTTARSNRASLIASESCSASADSRRIRSL